MPQGLLPFKYEEEYSTKKSTKKRINPQARPRWPGRIEFAIGCDGSREFRQAVADVPESQWRPLPGTIDALTQEAGRERAEVAFAAAEAGNCKKTPVRRHLAARFGLINLAGRGPVDPGDGSSVWARAFPAFRPCLRL